MTQGFPAVVGVPFECPRCTCKLSPNITTDNEGLIVARLWIGGEPTGDELVLWLDMPPRV
jgi:hypothetical protein